MAITGRGQSIRTAWAYLRGGSLFLGRSSYFGDADTADSDYRSDFFFPVSAAAYTLTAGTVAFATTGNVTALRKANQLPVTAATFTLIGISAGLMRANRLLTETAGYSTTGNDTVLRTANQLLVTAGTFTLAGNSAGVARANRLLAETGAFTLTVQDVAFLQTYGIVAQAGAFTYSGTAPILRAARKITTEFPLLPPVNIQATGGAEAVTLTWELPTLFQSYGQTAGLRINRPMVAAAGSFTLAGANARLSKTPAALVAFPPLAKPINLVAQSQGDDGAYLTWTPGYSFTTTGNDVELRRVNRMTADMPPTVPTGIIATPIPGGMTLEWTGVEALFTTTGNTASFPLGFGITAASVEFLSTFNDAGFTSTRRLLAEAGGFALTGNNAGLGQALQILAATGAFASTFSDSRLAAARKLTADSSVFTWTGNSADLRRALQILGVTGAFALTGNDADLIYTPRLLTLLAETGVFASTFNNAGMTRTFVLLALPASFLTTGADVFMGTGIGFSLPRGDLAIVLVPLDTYIDLISIETGIDLVSTATGIHLE